MLKRFRVSYFSGNLTSGDLKDWCKLTDEAMCSFSKFLHVFIVLLVDCGAWKILENYYTKLSFMYDRLSLGIDILLSNKYYVRFPILYTKLTSVEIVILIYMGHLFGVKS